MFSVRIDKDGDGYVFKVQPCEGSLEMVALDSAPGIIAMVWAHDPGDAAHRAWDKALRMHQPEQPSLPSATDDFLRELQEHRK